MNETKSAAPKNPWLAEAQLAAQAWLRGYTRAGYPGPGAVGLCARAARVLWENVTFKRYPFSHISATDMARDLRRHGKGEADYHAAVAHGQIAPGTWLFFGGNNGEGHVVTIVNVAAGTDLTKTTAGITIFENTSRKDDNGNPYGTHVGPLRDVLAIHGGVRGIVWVCRL